MPLRIVYFGTPEFSASFLRALMNDEAFDVVALVAQPDEPVGRKKILTPPATKVAFLETYPDRPVFQPTKLKDPSFADALAALEADYFVIVAYGRIIPAHLLALPRLGPVNVHPSLLPKHRGPSPMQAAIAQGDTETGISVMLIDAEMDHGPLLAQIRFPLAPDATYASLAAYVAGVGGQLLCDTLKAFADGRITPTEQDHSAATYCKLLSKDDGRVSALVDDAATIERKVRAYSPWPGVSLSLSTDKGLIAAKILRASLDDAILAPGAISTTKDAIIVGTPNGSLCIYELHPAGSKPMAAQAFNLGYSSREVL